MSPRLPINGEGGTPTCSERPIVDVFAWRALETQAGTVHLVMLREGGVVRNSSAVATIDPDLRAVTTLSNRRYQIHFPPEEEDMAKAILLANAVRIGLAGARDVSERLWAQLTGRLPAAGWERASSGVP